MVSVANVPNITLSVTTQLKDGVRAQLCLALCGPRDCRPPGCPVHGIFQERILGWVATSCSRGSSRPRSQTHVSWVSCAGRLLLYHWHHLGSPIAAHSFDRWHSASVSTSNGPITFLSPPVCVWCWFEVVLASCSGWHTLVSTPQEGLCNTVAVCFLAVRWD